VRKVSVEQALASQITEIDNPPSFHSSACKDWSELPGPGTKRCIARPPIMASLVDACAMRYDHAEQWQLLSLGSCQSTVELVFCEPATWINDETLAFPQLRLDR